MRPMKVDTNAEVQTRTGQRIALAVVFLGTFALAAVFAVKTPWLRSKINPTPTVIVEPNQHLTTEPHAFDVYRASNADKAIIFLHGGDATKEFAAYKLGVKTNLDTNSYIVADESLILGNKVIAVFPQGQTLRPNSAYTWNNYVMNSGEDDMQFLRDLVAHIRAQYHINFVVLAGHSNGGMMTNRVWCEEPELFDAYVAFSGPPSEHFLSHSTPCDPADRKPILNVVGSRDSVLQNTNWEAQKWTIDPELTGGIGFVDPVLIGARYYLTTQAARVCSTAVAGGDADATKQGTITSWEYCSSMVKLMRVENAEHTLDSLRIFSGQNLLQLSLDFAARFNEPGLI